MRAGEAECLAGDSTVRDKRLRSNWLQRLFVGTNHCRTEHEVTHSTVGLGKRAHNLSRGARNTTGSWEAGKLTVTVTAQPSQRGSCTAGSCSQKGEGTAKGHESKHTRAKGWVQALAKVRRGGQKKDAAWEIQSHCGMPQPPFFPDLRNYPGRCPDWRRGFVAYPLSFGKGVGDTHVSNLPVWFWFRLSGPTRALLF